MDRRHDIASVPGEISTCITQDGPPPSNGEGSKDPDQQLIINLRRKFFPVETVAPPRFFQNIFVLVAKASTVPTCKIDRVIDLLEEASDVARQDPQMQTGARKQGNSHRTSEPPAIQQRPQTSQTSQTSQTCFW